VCGMGWSWACEAGGDLGTMALRHFECGARRDLHAHP
jgi:hypothetical protein